MFRTRKASLNALLLGAALLLTAGCGGGGGGFYDPLGAVDVHNATFSDDLTYFEVTPAGAIGGSGDLLGGPLFPGEVAYVGDFYEDYYDLDFIFFFGGLGTYFDYPIYGDAVNVVDVF